jgi:hypothetical protein
LLEGNKKLIDQIPITIKNYDLAYAFDIFAFNIIRNLNFLVDLKSRIKDNYSSEYALDVKKFYDKKKDYEHQDEFDKIFIKNYDVWLESFKNNRGEITHKRISKIMPALWNFEARRIDENSVNKKERLKIMLPNLNIDDLEDYIKNIFTQFNDAIKNLLINI